jgi:hypothetical protein
VIAGGGSIVITFDGETPPLPVGLRAVRPCPACHARLYPGRHSALVSAGLPGQPFLQTMWATDRACKAVKRGMPRGNSGLEGMFDRGKGEQRI